MAEIELLKGFASSHPQLQTTAIVQKLIDWVPSDNIQPNYDLELSLEEADTIIDTLHTILVDNQAEQTKVAALVDKFKSFYSEKSVSDNSTASK